MARDAWPASDPSPFGAVYSVVPLALHDRVWAVYGHGQRQPRRRLRDPLRA